MYQKLSFSFQSFNLYQIVPTVKILPINGWMMCYEGVNAGASIHTGNT